MRQGMILNDSNGEKKPLWMIYGKAVSRLENMFIGMCNFKMYQPVEVRDLVLNKVPEQNFSVK